MSVSILILGDDPNQINVSVLSIRLHCKESEYEIFIATKNIQNLNTQFLNERNDCKLININPEDITSAYLKFIQDSSGKIILFLYAGTFIAYNSLLMMYQLLSVNEKIGAVGPQMNHIIYNNMNNQLNNGGGGGYSNFTELEEVAKKISESQSLPKITLLLEGSCLLIRRETLQRIGAPITSFGSLWSADYSIRLIQAGYDLLICNQAFVHVVPSSLYSEKSIPSFASEFQKKWGFDILCNQKIYLDMVQSIDFKRNNVKILNVGCACGHHLMLINKINSTAKLYGLEKNPHSARIAKIFANVTVADPEFYDNLEWNNYFDFIILTDVLDYSFDVISLLGKMYRWLNYDGKLILNVKNMLNINMLAEMLGIGRVKAMNEDLDKKFIRHFTRNEIVLYLRKNNFLIDTQSGINVNISDRANELLGKIFSTKGHEVYPAEFAALQFIICSSKNHKLDTLPPLKEDSLDFDLSEIKLIIWDLDECFWHGTLSSENPIEPVVKNIEIVKRLTDCGVINSICSKNDFDDVKTELINQNVWEYFVFPSIDWSSKGNRIKEIISNMQLRTPNVLFIDDNMSNLEEAKYYLPELKILNVNEIDKLYSAVEQLPMKDTKHERLNRYKILENKSEIRKQLSSNEEFLYQSEIKISFNRDCLSVIDRIVELIFRTNQLNYTKNRMQKEQLVDLINDSNCECAAINVKDKYGDYGCVGFYCLNKSQNKLIHFLFSCRVLGMGVEQFVFSKLNFPSFKIVGEIATPLKNNVNVEWIEEIDYKFDDKNQNKKIDSEEKCIFVKGPCDMETLIRFINIEGVTIHPELFWNNNEGRIVACLDTTSILNSRTMSKKQFKELKETAPWLDEANFRTDIFNPKYQIIFFSLLSDSGVALYRNNKNGIKICGSREDMTDESNWEKIRSREELGLGYEYTYDILDNFRKSYTYLNYIEAQEIIDNLKKMLSLLSSDTLLVLFLGSEIDCTITPREEWSGLYKRHKEINPLVENEFKNVSNIKIINYTNYIKSQDDFADGIINHFQARVYYEIAKDIVNIIKEYYRIN